MQMRLSSGRGLVNPSLVAHHTNTLTSACLVPLSLQDHALSPRTVAPCDVEIMALVQLSAVPVLVRLQDGNKVEVMADSWTSVADLEKQASRQAGRRTGRQAGRQCRGTPWVYPLDPAGMIGITHGLPQDTVKKRGNPLKIQITNQPFLWTAGFWSVLR